MDQDKYTTLLQSIISLETQVEVIDESVVSRSEINAIETQMDQAIQDMNDLADKIDVFESVTIGSDELRDLLAMKAQVSRILSELENIKDRYPS